MSIEATLFQLIDVGVLWPNGPFSIKKSVFLISIVFWSKIDWWAVKENKHWGPDLLAKLIPSFFWIKYNLIESS